MRDFFRPCGTCKFSVDLTEDISYYVESTAECVGLINCVMKPEKEETEPNTVDLFNACIGPNPGKVL